MGPYIKLFASVQEAKLLAEWPLIEYKAYRPHSALIRTEAAKGVTPSHAPLNHFKKNFLPVLNSIMSMPDDNFNESIDSIDLKDALALAAYTEQLLMTEQQWILNRLSWLFTSQSFLITAFVVLLGSGNHSPSAHLLRIALPLLGLFCCIGWAAWLRRRSKQAKVSGSDKCSCRCWAAANCTLSEPRRAKASA